MIDDGLRPKVTEDLHSTTASTAMPDASDSTKDSHTTSLYSTIEDDDLPQYAIVLIGVIPVTIIAIAVFAVGALLFCAFRMRYKR